MKSALRTRLAEKNGRRNHALCIPGEALKKWRLAFRIAPGVLADKMGVSPSVISDYEGGRRKSPGTAVVGKIVDSILSIDEANGGRHISKFGKILYNDFDPDVIYDMHDYNMPVQLTQFCSAIACTHLVGSMDQQIYGYTVVNSENAILKLSANEFNRIYGWSTERALIFTNVSTGKSPMIAIRVTPFKPRCVILQGISPKEVHPLVPRLAESDRITLLCTEMDVNEIVDILREE